MQELWLQHNQVAQLSFLSPLSALPSLTALFLSPNPLCAALKTDYRAAVVSTLSSLQVSCCSVVTCTYSAAVGTLRPRRILIHTGQCGVCCCCNLSCCRSQTRSMVHAAPCRSNAVSGMSSAASCFCDLCCCSKRCDRDSS